MSFEETAQRAEQLAQKNMGLYKFKLFLYGVLGYVVIFGLLAMLIGLVVGMVLIGIKSPAILIILAKKKILFLLIPVIWVMLTALWVKMEAPDGYRVTAEEFPKLFEAITAISNQLKAPKVHQVILTPQLNASISQTPRLGVFGWNKNTLTLGVELLMVLSPQQASSVVAHELGHLSGNHAKFNGWIYRVRLSWYRIMKAFDERSGMGISMMRKFFDWYAPKFAAHSFALARANEYEADRMAAELTDKDIAGDALINVHVAAPYTEENYWQKFFKKADEMPQPDHMPWAGLTDWLHTDEAAHDDIVKRLETEMQVETTYENTHPSLKDRLASLDAAAQLPERINQSAAREWLGDQYAAVIQRFDNEWVEQVGDNWKQRYEYVQTSRTTLAELSGKEDDGLSDDELWNKACLTEEFDSEETALGVFKVYQQRYPENPVVAYTIGRLQYEKNDEALLEQMKLALSHATAEQTDLTISACQYAYSTLEKADRLDEAQWWVDQANETAAANAEINAERAQLDPKDELATVELNEEDKNYLVEQLRALPKIKHAWIAQKVVKHNPESRVLAIAATVGGFVSDDEAYMNQAIEQLKIGVDYFFVPKLGNYKKLAKKIIKTGDQLF